MNYDYNIGIHPEFGKYTIENDIIVAPLWTETFCSQMIDLVEENLHHVEISYDSAQMFPLNYLNFNLMVSYASHFKTAIIPMLKKEWMMRYSHPRVDIPGLFTPFFLKYSGEYDHLDLHTDSGIVSMALKLNDNYEGCNLTFPRQGFSAKNVPIGHAIFWPGLLTHPHMVTRLERGIKYGFNSFACPPEQFLNPHGLYLKYVK